MSLYELILLFVSIFPVFLIGRYIYKADKNKEPGKLLVKLFLGGIGSCFLVLIVTWILEATSPIFSANINDLTFFELIVNVFIGVALVEESCKWIMAYSISYNKDDFDELYDAILYCMFVSLGFACLENVLYVFQGGIGTGLLRAFLAVPGHACDGVFMGYYLGVAKISELNGRQDLKRKNIILSIVAPTITHGIYDFCLFTGSSLFVILFFVFVIWMYIYAVKKIKKISSLNRKMKYKDNYCPICGRRVESNYCPNCGRKHE